MTEDPTVFDVTETDGVKVIHLNSDMFDELHVAAFRRQLLAYINENPSERLVVSLDKVQKLGSECIGILVHGLNQIQQSGGDLRLCSLSEISTKMFQICKLIPQTFAAYPSSADAVQSYQ